MGQLAASFNRMVEGILEAQERLRRSEKETFRSEKLATVGRLAAGVAHEVGNPLMAIRGYAEHLLKHHPGAAESKACRNEVVEEAKRIANIVRGRLAGASHGDGRDGAAAIPTGSLASDRAHDDRGAWTCRGSRSRWSSQIAMPPPYLPEKKFVRQIRPRVSSW